MQWHFSYGRKVLGHVFQRVVTIWLKVNSPGVDVYGMHFVLSGETMANAMSSVEKRDTVDRERVDILLFKA